MHSVRPAELPSAPEGLWLFQHHWIAYLHCLTLTNFAINQRVLHGFIYFDRSRLGPGFLTLDLWPS